MKCKPLFTLLSTVGLALAWLIGPPRAVHTQEPNSVYFVSTCAGTGIPGDGDGSRAVARFHGPAAFVVDQDGNLYVGDAWNNKIRKISAAGEVTTIAGTGAAGFDNGPAKSATFALPGVFGLDNSGNLYIIEESGHHVRKITPDGTVSTFVGSPTGTPGFQDGIGTSALFNGPCSADLDSLGNLYIGERHNHTVRKITPDGVVTTFAGTGTPGYVDGDRLSAQFNAPCGVAIDQFDNMYIADWENRRIRKITPFGQVTTIAGNGNTGFVDGIGPNAEFGSMSDLVVDDLGNIYIAECGNVIGNRTVRKLTPLGNDTYDVSTIAGSNTAEPIYRDGPGSIARFHNPSDIGVDAGGNIFVTDFGDHRIRKIVSANVIPVDTEIPDIDPDDGLCSLTEAIINANDDAQTQDNCPAGSEIDMIFLQATGRHTLTASLPSITSEIIIDGNRAQIVRSSDIPSFRIFYVPPEGDLTLYDLTVSSGAAVLGNGGGIYNSGGVVTLISSILSHNEAGNGGGIYNSGGVVVLISSTLRSNWAWYGNGGGIYNSGGVVTLIESTVTGNGTVGLGVCGSGDTGGPGAGIFNDGGMVELISSTVSANRAGCDAVGGGIFNRGTVVLHNSTVSHNRALHGGGVVNAGGILELVNCTVSKNHARGLWAEESGVGGGIRNRYGTVELLNTIVANNTAYGFITHEDCPSDCQGEAFHSLGNNLDSDGRCDLDPAKNDLPRTDPRLGRLQDNDGPTETHGLLDDSPAIDHIPEGTNGCGIVPLDTDQRGQRRPADGNEDGILRCDIGAFELQEGETAINLLSFTAHPAADHITLAWETSTEVDNAGFNLWRAVAADGPYTKLNDVLIPAEGDPESGASYTYTDTDVVKGVTYYYKLEDVDIHGASAFHGPVSATPGRIRRVYLPLVLK